MNDMELIEHLNKKNRTIQTLKADHEALLDKILEISERGQSQGYGWITKLIKDSRNGK